MFGPGGHTLRTKDYTGNSSRHSEVQLPAHSLLVGVPGPGASAMPDGQLPARYRSARWSLIIPDVVNSLVKVMNTIAGIENKGSKAKGSSKRAWKQISRDEVVTSHA